MIIEDLSMLVTETSRSKAYLTSLLRHDFYPAKVLLLKDSDEDIKPGQIKVKNEINPKYTTGEWSEANFDLKRTVEDILIENKFDFKKVDNIDINSSEIVEELSLLDSSVVLYSGFGGILLREPLFRIGKKFLHAHGGYLPDYKGSTTNYYSLINESAVGASTLFLNEQIDSGKILHRKKFLLDSDRENIDHIYDSAARCKVLVETISHYTKTNSWEVIQEDISSLEGETYHVVHPILKHISILSNS
jgi:methionyl-tRNA formyltransferase